MSLLKLVLRGASKIVIVLSSYPEWFSHYRDKAHGLNDIRFTVRFPKGFYFFTTDSPTWDLYGSLTHSLLQLA